MAQPRNDANKTITMHKTMIQITFGSSNGGTGGGIGLIKGLTPVGSSWFPM
jgi:hypothetical protein